MKIVYYMLIIIIGENMNISKVLSTGVLATMLAVFISGCSGANVGSQMRMSDTNSNMESRCIEIDMRSNSEMEEELARYDGWRVFYISEYTTDNKVGTSASVCFERPRR